MNGPLPRPEPRRIVPRAVVDALVADADREISSLELRVARATTAAGVAEARLAELGIDEQTSAWATVVLQRFLAELRAAADAESLAVVGAAEVRGRLLVEEAAGEARHHGRFAAVPVPAFASEPEPEPEPEPERDAVFHAITPEALAAADDGASLDGEFWPPTPPRTRRFPRVRTVAAPTLAGLLVVAAVVLRVA